MGINTKQYKVVTNGDMSADVVSKVIDLGPNIAPHGMAATHDGKIWVTADLSSIGATQQ